MSSPHTFKVTAGIVCVMRRSYFTNSYFTDTPSGLVAIDAGMKSHGGDMLAALAELGRTPSDVRAILVTHWHNDHAAGAAELAEVTRAPVYYHQTEALHLTRVKAFAGVRGAISSWVPETGPLVLVKGLLGNAPQRAVAATHFVAHGQVILEEFEVIETPGHTEGHVSYYHLPTGTLFAGDALAVIAQRIRFMARPVTEDLEKARRSMQKCMDREIHFVCPGHREPLMTNAEAEVQRFRALLDSSTPWPLFG
ncbi:MAG: Zn-dependent hydrolase, glyoxylase [Phycisphaerales bacterium]|nr:Zn-dependent hydrolase, glyoxylase [Phycisphaerales bacterium]